MNNEDPADPSAHERDDLIARLRALSRHEHSDMTIGDEAADALERLAPQVAAVIAAERETCTKLLKRSLASRQQAPPADVAPPNPIAWVQPDHLQKARRAPFMCRVEPTQRCADFVPIYTADQMRAYAAAAVAAERKRLHPFEPATERRDPVPDLAAFDAAVAAELRLVSHVHYDSHEICKHFSGELRAALYAVERAP